MTFQGVSKTYQKEYTDIFVDYETCEQLLLPYRMALRLTQAILEGLNDEMKCTYAHSPIHSIKGRIKTPESILGKLHRRGFEISLKGVWQLQDISGLRVICKYVNDIYYIRERLLLHRDIELVRESDYVKQPKENGYRSYHMIITVPVYNSDGKTRVPVEIQIRTIAMDMWASLEHNLHYKSEFETNEEIIQRLSRCSAMLKDVDEEMQSIYQELNEQWLHSS